MRPVETTQEISVGWEDMALRKHAVNMWPGCMWLNWDVFVGSGERGDGS
jgi:hypothetical protein